MDSLYLSQLPLSMRNRAVQSDLSDCHAMHRRLLLAFPNLGGLPDARDHFGVLYRIEPTHHGMDVLLQSNTEPDWSRLPEGYLRAEAPQAKRIDPLYAAIHDGQRLLFRLRANPTRRIGNRNMTQGEQWRGKRVELRREEDLLTWLTRKGEQAGFALLVVRAQPLTRDGQPQQAIADVRATGMGNHVTGGRRPSRLTFASVTFEGRLRVTDANAFREALYQGIGSGKAFGFGLLSIAPIPA
ncbi:MAG TPA: type I-E CRISPR-associated protein Cas6/Cse3/CasE [Ktedonobacterales bacterium]|nr:type I-E CRISPR-associated protein Cas6/Cse3/CasE [Ktedonobacterales bacterium]